MTTRHEKHRWQDLGVVFYAFKYKNNSINKDADKAKGREATTRTN